MRPLRTPGEMKPLIDFLPASICMIELGSFSGESTRQFLQSPKIKQLHCVDMWQGGYDPDDLASKWDMQWAERLFDQVLSDPRVVKHKMDTLAAASQFLDGSMDFVYIDANHTYDFVKRDIIAYRPKIKKGMYIGGHDYGETTHPGVQKAVDELLGKPDLVFPDRSWVKKI
jgi:hypothetical protein